ncbi:MAG: hypothetical protein GY714_08635 [Desulfobacterales bacterium]|nr:hypothetical protein [Desulfobacterales bacterium]
MEIKSPQTMTGASAFIEGVGFLGTTKEVELPKIEFEEWESKSGLMVRKIDSGVLKPMTAKIVLEEYNDVYYEALKKRFNHNASIYLKQNLAPDYTSIVATFGGSVTSLESPKTELAKEVNVTLNLNLWFYKFEIDGSEKILADLKSFILRIDGDDIYSQIRANL